MVRYFITALTAVFFSSIVFAHQQTVVIPLGGAKTINAQNFLPVYDSSDVFVGYLLPESSVDDGYTVVSPRGYAMRIKEDGTGYNFWIEAYYKTADCSDSPKVYTEQTSVDMLHPNPQSSKGQVFLIDSSLYYVPLTATQLNASVSFYQKSSTVTCSNPRTISQTYYEVFPNNPAVTGFQNSYNLPFKTVYSIPTAP